MKRLLEWVCGMMPSRTIPGPDGAPYLTKYRVASVGGRNGWRLHLHRFWRGDADREPHTHPFAWSRSLILSGGYREERVVYEGHRRITTWRTMRPGSVNRLDRETLHRIDLLGGECWTLFLTGPVVGSWGFVEQDGTYVPWREFVARRGQDPVEGEYWKERRL